MRFLRNLLLGLAALAVLGVALAYALPRRVRVERSTVIAAPRATVYALVGGFRTFPEWSPWRDRDPGATYRNAGQASGVGARVAWDSREPDVASGSAEIIDVARDERVGVRLEFAHQGRAEYELHLARASDGTRVTWAFDVDLGPNPLARYLGPRFDSALGPDLERALARLKALAEALPRADFGDLEVELVDSPSILAAWTEGASSTDPDEAGAALAQAHERLRKFLASRRLSEVAPPIRVMTHDDPSAVSFDAGIPIDRVPEKAAPERSPVRIGRTEARRALRAVHRGSYADLRTTRDKLVAYATAHGYRIDGNVWDQPATDPRSTPDEQLVTHVFLPVGPGS
jgi:effector-binding domain-containing protein/uncharacterized protein YndB with AHSA1/START domain